LKNGATTQDGMHVVYHAIDNLVFSEYNPRELTKHQHAALVESIEGFNWVVPIVINTNKKRKNVVVGGHQRLKVARELGHSKVPCIEVDLPVEREKELNIRLNQNTGQWDWDALANYFDVGELTEWGFTDDQLIGWHEAYKDDYARPDFEHLIDEFAEKKDTALTKDYNWFYIEYYGDDKRFKELKALLEANMVTEHEIDKEFFYEYIRKLDAV
jgi:hypothetical protein|tara:strand:- start:945 stop:1586 length:642 start_codon:yes stop_codon:yes gene_type:complete